MAISTKCRKLLWGRSGNRCSICRRELIMDASTNDDESIVGEECHIISGSVNGPRANPNLDLKLIDDYLNLILVCRVHHKQIDDQESTYNNTVLHEIKKNHERWVNEKLNSERGKDKQIKIKQIYKNIPAYLTRIESGKELLDIILDSDGYQFDHDELQTNDEAEVVSSFLQNAQDWGEIGLEESGQKVSVGFELNNSIKEVENMGFWVFGAREIRVLECGDNSPSDFTIAILRVIRNDNIEIVNLSKIKGGV